MLTKAGYVVVGTHSLTKAGMDKEAGRERNLQLRCQRWLKKWVLTVKRPCMWA